METVGNPEAFAFPEFLSRCLVISLGQKCCLTQASCPVAMVTVKEGIPCAFVFYLWCSLNQCTVTFTRLRISSKNT